MRDRAERFAVLPFSNACTSESSVYLGPAHNSKKPKSDHQPIPPLTRKQGDKERSSSRVKMKNSFGFLALPKPSIAGGIHRVIRSIKVFLSSLVSG
ncbi:hypothetical protein SLA2020_415810 [Shorea laevis]